MLNPNSYCRAVATLPENSIDRIYHDQRYGFPIDDDNELFGRLILEINQAGLSWSTILKKEAHFRRAYDAFQIEKIAGYTSNEVERLMADTGIIRNRLKIEAAIFNAQVIMGLKEVYGSFKNWLDLHKGLDKPEWTKLFKKTFKFTGGEIVSEFLMSTAYLGGAHDQDCPTGKIIAQSQRIP
jgi:DNA-3-methyladenine glycosylase I